MLKIFNYYLAIQDLMMFFIMTWSLFSQPPFLLPFSSNSVEFRFAMGWAATFMLAWTVLLIWAAQKPFERKMILIFTLLFVVGGFLLTEILVAPIELMQVIIGQIITVLIPGIIVCLHIKE